METPRDDSPGEDTELSVEIDTAEAEAEARGFETQSTAGLPRRPGPDLDDAPKIDRFVILRKLGEGGMGVVYIGYDELLDRKVAIKRLRPQVHGTSASARLLREAQGLAKVSHPNVVQVHASGVHRGAVYIAMELVDGLTLKEWACGDESPRSWRARLEMLIQAGRGLEAVHAAGLMHRDFKPDNVLVGADGRVRVLDFGLVRGLDGGASSSSQVFFETAEEGDPILTAPSSAAARDATWDPDNSNLLDAPLTLRGAVIGTPAYMAPEQQAGLPCGPQADQYAFCVTAFELLYGVRPFLALGLTELLTRKRAGKIVEVEPDPELPPALRTILAQGLAASPADRHLDMGALLRALERLLEPPAPSRRWPLVMSAAIIGTILGSVVISNGEPSESSCTVERSALAGVWDEERRAAARAAFEATGVSVAGASFDRAASTLDGWTDAWLATQTASCEDRSQSAQLRDRRRACLDRRLAEAGAVTEVLASADLGVLMELDVVLGELPELDACSVAALVPEGGELQPRPASAEQLELSRELVRARIERGLGRVAAADDRAQQVQRAADELGDLQLGLEARALQAQIVIDAGVLADGLGTLRSLADQAEEAGLGELAAGLRVELARAAAGDFGPAVVETWLIEDAAKALARVGRAADPREVTLEVARARVAEQGREWDEARAHYERADVLAAERLPLAQREALRLGLANFHAERGELDEARAEYARALAGAREVWGDASPNVANIEYDLGLLELDAGDADAARVHLERALELHASNWGEASLPVARARFGLAQLEFDAGSAQRASALITQALPVFEDALGSDHDETARVLHGGAAVRFVVDGDSIGALALLDRAIEIQRERLGPDDPELAQLHADHGEVSLALGRHEDALRDYERAAAIIAEAPGEHAELRWTAGQGQGRALLGLGRPAEALARLDRALTWVDPDDALTRATLNFDRAQALAGSGADLTSARALAEAAATALAAAGEDDQAIRAWLNQRFK